MSVTPLISLPDDLAARMDAIEVQVNWSAEAVKCFEKVLGNIAARKRHKDYSNVVARLRASKLETAEESYESGHKAGVAWAEHKASYPDLKRAVSYDKNQINAQWPAPWRGCDWVAFAVQGLDVFDSPADDLELLSNGFWREVDDYQSMNSIEDEFLIGFIDGATQVWNQVQDQL